MLNLRILISMLFISSISLAQVVGSGSNSDLIPTNVEASQLSGGGYSGDVNVFNGSYSSSYPLGTVSTPGGLSYSVSLNYSPTYSAGESPSICAGIPYGEGWHVNMPMITVSNAAYFPFLAEYERAQRNKPTPIDTNYFLINDTINNVLRSAGTTNGDTYWFSPQISLPNVGSGKAIFKYIDDDDAGCAVFVMNKFERYVEARFYGSHWEIIDDAGNRYSMGTTLVTYRAPNNQRVLNYNTSDVDDNNQVQGVIVNNEYSGLADEVLNVIEPKQAFTSWYCNAMYNRNIPKQTIQFEYEKFGAFNYFQEFEQVQLYPEISSKLRGLTFPYTEDYTAYTDIFLKRVVSNVMASPFEILNLEYELLQSADIPGHILDPRDSDVDRLDSLYSYTTVFSDGSESDFVDWNRYFHGRSDSAVTKVGNQVSISGYNPYLTSNNGGTGPAYLRSEVEEDTMISFNHAFLESPRILKDASTLVSGDIYEVRTQIIDGNGSSHQMGNGTVDINIATGDLNFRLGGSYCSSGHFENVGDSVYYVCDTMKTFPAGVDSYGTLNAVDGAGRLVDEAYNATRGASVFSTHNQAIKWYMPSTDNNISTSNFFVMPNVPNHCDGVNIQIGPGNSDTEYSAEPIVSGGYTTRVVKQTASNPTAYGAYSHRNPWGAGRLPSFADISNSFGIGLPWSMVEPLYVDQMGGVGTEPRLSPMYKFWWNDSITHYPSATWDNEPTKFDDNVNLKKVELIRYSKSPYMLKNAKVYRVNGEITSLDDTSGMVLISDQEMDYDVNSTKLFENLNYRVGGAYNDTLLVDIAAVHWVYTLEEIKNIPTGAWEDDPSVKDAYTETEILQTEFEYEWYGVDPDNEYINYSLVGNPGKRGRVMTKVIDQLGGETVIEYYPMESAFTLMEYTYTPLTSILAGNADPVIPPSSARDVHPSVHYLTKLDEQDNLTDTTLSVPLKRWEYVYDTTQVIYHTKDYSLPSNFRNGYRKSYSKGFAKSTLYEPELATGEQPYTEYFHHGNVIDSTVDVPTIEEYLFFGKPDSIVQYNSTGTIEEISFFEYEYVKAHENGYERPNFIRDNLVGPLDFDGLANYVNSREYEYADYRKGDSVTYTGIIGRNMVFDDPNSTNETYVIMPGNDTIQEGEILQFRNFAGGINTYHLWWNIPFGYLDFVSVTGTLSNEQAKGIKLDGSYLSNLWSGPIEKSAFLETSFYEDLKENSENPEFYFHSYFVKTASQTNRVYDNSCFKAEEVLTPGIISGPPSEDDPFGDPYVNPVSHGEVQQGVEDDILGAEGDGEDIMQDLKDASPLSDINLDALINKEGFSASVITEVLLEQSALSVNIMKEIIDNVSIFSTRNLSDIYSDQPYISDDVQIHATASIEGNWSNFGSLFTQNDYLSDQVMEACIEEQNFPQSNLKDILLDQGQLSEPVLLKLSDDQNNVDDFVVNAVVMNQAVLTDSIFENVLANTNLTASDVSIIFIQSTNYPNDTILSDMMDDPRFDEDAIVENLTSSTRVFGSTLRTKITNDLSYAAAASVFDAQDDANPNGKYCNNPIEIGRDYIETVTEYEYYEAEYDGKTEALGYEKLFGLEDVDGKIVSIDYPHGAVNDTLEHIILKHEPSWQLFKSKTYSPQYAGAYSEEEYYYYYDQMNRVSRHVEFYDWASTNYLMDIDVHDYYDDTLVYHTQWPADFLIDTAYTGQFPLTDAARFSQRSDVRNVAYQKTSFTQNNLDTIPLMRSEYYFYDSRWNDVDFWVDSTRNYSGPSCPAGSPAPCDSNSYECADCIYIKWLGSTESVLNQVPYGYCAHYVNSLWYYACPIGTDLTDYGATTDYIEGCYPVDGDGSQSSTKALPYEEALDAVFHLKQVVVQIDTTSVGGEWSQFRNDSSNSYIMDFRLGTGAELDSLNRRISFGLYPFDTLTVRTIDERNEHLQVQLEHNAEAIYTKYYYSTPVRIWNVNTNNGSCSGYGNYSSTYSTEIGLPQRITVGYGRTDSLSTTYAYHPSYALDSIVNPNGYELKYEYDDYDRLYKTYENDRLLSQNAYEYWNRTGADDFLERTDENYVETYLYNGPIIGGNYEGEHIRAFVDPLGRNYSTTTNIDGDSTQVHSGSLIYDNWSRVVKAHKPYELLNQVNLSRTLDTNQAYTQNAYENDHKSRVLRNAKYGITDFNSQYTVKQTYKIINHVVLSCELDLSLYETNLLLKEYKYSTDKFTMVGIEDEDGKTKFEYYNGIGQKIGTKQFGDHTGDEIITLYTYDSYGNLNRVINPERQETTYEYNILGQLFRETTVDAGEHKFMYNKLGLVSFELDENGAAGDTLEVGDTTLYKSYRVYQYDDYGRLIKQSYTGLVKPFLNEQNEQIDILFYRDTLLSSGQPYFECSFNNKSTLDWASQLGVVGADAPPLFGPDAIHSVLEIMNANSGYSATEKDFTYGTNSALNNLGKIVTSTSYAADGVHTGVNEYYQTVNYEYDDEERISRELITFNPQDTSRLVTVAIDYPEYNYRGSLLTLNVDVHDDNILDFQYHYMYDDWNRLRDVYANFDSSKTEGNLIVHYDYNDALGLLTQTTHYEHIDPNWPGECGDSVAQTIAYAYDVRDRLTSISSELMDYNLYYDNQIIPAIQGAYVAHDKNWNGNINGIKTDYHLDLSGVQNPGGPAGVFDEASVYGYKYDLINRLYEADGSVGDRIESTNSLTFDISDVVYDYDRIGNLKNLRRYTGIDTSGSNNDLIAQEWNYKYASGTNRLDSLVGQSGTTSRYYTYDLNGNLATDDVRDLVSIDYTRANYPHHISKTDNEIDYLYNVGNLRVYKRSETSADSTEEYYLKSSSGQDLGILDMLTNDWIWYVNGTDRVAKVIPTTYQQPDSLSLVGGCDADSNYTDVHYYLNDHLGNTRVVYQPVRRPPNTCQEAWYIIYAADYYPYGKILREYSNGPVEKFLTTQHERDLESGLDYRGARFYDSDVARFLSLDPLAADYPSLSDYSYVAGNPVMFFDPTGKAVESIGDPLRRKVIKMKFDVSNDAGTGQLQYNVRGVGNYTPEQNRGLRFITGTNLYTLRAGEPRIASGISRTRNLSNIQSVVVTKNRRLKVGDVITIQKTNTGGAGGAVQPDVYTIRNNRDKRKYKKIETKLDINDPNTGTTNNVSITVRRGPGNTNYARSQSRVESTITFEGLVNPNTRRKYKRRARIK